MKSCYRGGINHDFLWTSTMNNQVHFLFIFIKATFLNDIFSFSWSFKGYMNLYFFNGSSSLRYSGSFSSNAKNLTDFLLSSSISNIKITQNIIYVASRGFSSMCTDSSSPFTQWCNSGWFLVCFRFLRNLPNHFCFCFHFLVTTVHGGMRWRKVYKNFRIFIWRVDIDIWDSDFLNHIFPWKKYKNIIFSSIFFDNMP